MEKEKGYHKRRVRKLSGRIEKLQAQKSVLQENLLEDAKKKRKRDVESDDSNVENLEESSDPEGDLPSESESQDNADLDSTDEDVKNSEEYRLYVTKDFLGVNNKKKKTENESE
jgi:hypothetical protein